MANWIFQANPARYDVYADLQAGAIANWSVGRHLGDLQEADRAALWIAGGKGGVAALGRVAGTLPAVPEDDEEEVEADEGRLFYRQRRRYERDRKLVARKKAAVTKVGKPLACEVCGFDFGAVFGELGDGYIECHHLVPLSAGPTRNKLADLALLCSNCHRMIHRRKPGRLPWSYSRRAELQASAVNDSLDCREADVARAMPSLGSNWRWS